MILAADGQFEHWSKIKTPGIAFLQTGLFLCPGMDCMSREDRSPKRRYIRLVMEHIRKLFLLATRINQSARVIFSIFTIMLLPASVQADDASVMAKLAGHSMLLDGLSTDGLMAVVGERGHVLISSDGKNWQQVSVPTRTTLTGVYFHDKMRGWVVGHDAVILRTMDGGKTWEKVYYDPEGQTPLFDIRFRDEKHGIAIGAYGLYIVSEDGGASWTVSEMNVSVVSSANDSDDEKAKAEDDDDFLDSYDLHLNSIAIADNGKLYIAAEAGKVYRSDNFGESWGPLAPDYIGSFFGVLPVTGDTVLVLDYEVIYFVQKMQVKPGKKLIRQRRKC